jgi:Luciferase-like monooxygenase
MQRFDITISPAVAERALGRANIAPTQSVLAVVNGEDGSREAVLARFGLAPAWAKLRGGPITYRHPAVAANIAATIDHISGGRAENGVGAAWFEQEHREYGIPTGTGTICKGARHLVEEPVDTEIVCGRVAPASLPDHHLGVVDADGNLTRRVIFERWKPAWWSNPLTGAMVPYTQTNKFTVVSPSPAIWTPRPPRSSARRSGPTPRRTRRCCEASDARCSRLTRRSSSARGNSRSSTRSSTVTCPSSTPFVRRSRRNRRAGTPPPAARRDRAKDLVLWPDPDLNERKLTGKPGLRPGLHHRENPANKPNSGVAHAWIAPKRPPVRVRLAPLTPANRPETRLC